MKGSFSSRFTYENSTAAAQVTSVASGEAVTVHGILISNLTASNSEVTVRTADGNETTLFSIELDRSELFNVEVPFLADKGIEIVNVSGDSIQITVFHSNPGL